MKKHTGNNIKLGIFISLGTAVFIAGIYFIGEGQQLFRSTFRLNGVFKDVGGLQAGNNVRLSGVNVGTVENISIVSDSTVRVVMLIDERSRKFIKKDAVAGIGSEGLMGNKTLIIYPGIGGEEGIEDNDIIETSQPMSLDDVFASLKKTIDNASSITGDLSKITNNIQSGKGTIGMLLMDKSARQNFDSTIANLKEGAAGFKILVDKGDDIDEILTSLKTSVNNTSTITDNLSKITDSIHAGKGTLGMLLMDKSLGQNFDSTMINLKNGTAGLKSLTEKAKKSWLLWGN